MEHNRAGDALAGLAGVEQIVWMCPDGYTAVVTRDGKRLSLDLRTGTVVETYRAKAPPNTLRGVAEGSHFLSGWRFATRVEGGQIQLLAYHLLSNAEVRGLFAFPDSEPPHTSLPPARFRYAFSDDDAHASLLTAHSLYVLRLPARPPKGPN